MPSQSVKALPSLPGAGYGRGQGAGLDDGTRRPGGRAGGRAGGQRLHAARGICLRVRVRLQQPACAALGPSGPRPRRFSVLKRLARGPAPLAAARGRPLVMSLSRYSVSTPTAPG